MVYCVAYNCTNGSGSGKSTFTFPKDQKRRRQWANLVNIKDFVPGKFYNPVLCEDHFQLGCFRNNPEICKQLGRKLFLNEDAVPTIFSKTKTPTKPNYGQDVDSPTVKKQRKSFALTKRHAREVPCGILQAGASSTHAEVEDVESHHETDNAHHSIAVEIQTDPVAQQQGHVLVTSRQCQAELRRPHYSRSIMATLEVKSVLLGGDCVWETKDIGSQTELPLQPVESDPEIPEAESEDEDDNDFYDANDDNGPDYDPAGFL